MALIKPHSSTEPSHYLHRELLRNYHGPLNSFMLRKSADGDGCPHEVHPSGPEGGGGVPLGVKSGPCHKALGAHTQKKHPVTIYLTKNVHMHTLYWYGRTLYSAVYHHHDHNMYIHKNMLPSRTRCRWCRERGPVINIVGWEPGIVGWEATLW